MKVHLRGLELVKPGVKCRFVSYHQLTPPWLTSPPSEIADELNEMVLSQGHIDLRSFGYGHTMGLVSYYYGRSDTTSNTTPRILKKASELLFFVGTVIF